MMIYRQQPVKTLDDEYVVDMLGLLEDIRNEIKNNNEITLLTSGLVPWVDKGQRTKRIKELLDNASKRRDAYWSDSAKNIG